MFVLGSKITITQVNKTPYTGRNKSFIFNYVNDCEIVSTWAHLTDTAKIILPRKIFYTDNNGNKVAWQANTDIYGNPNKVPLIMRGDKIKIELGYFYFSTTGVRQLISTFNTEFQGYITRIENKMPVVLHCEDNMYILKQTRVPDKVWSASKYTIETMLKEMITYNSEASTFTINTDNYKHQTGDFITKGNTMAQVLDTLRGSNYHLESWFRGNELRCGIIRYYPNEKVNHILHFQKNIANDSLDYTRADDIKIGVKAVSINKIALQATNSSGKFKTTHKKLEVNVGDFSGEVRTLHFAGVTNENDLKARANVILPYLNYTGFRGNLTTFGLPFVKHGDSVQLIDAIIPERGGTYLVKEVRTKFGMNGYRRDLGLDIRIDGLSATQLNQFQNFGL